MFARHHALYCAARVFGGGLFWRPIAFSKLALMLQRPSQLCTCVWSDPTFSTFDKFVYTRMWVNLDGPVGGSIVWCVKFQLKLSETFPQSFESQKTFISPLFNTDWNLGKVRFGWNSNLSFNQGFKRLSVNRVRSLWVCVCVCVCLCVCTRLLAPADFTSLKVPSRVLNFFLFQFDKTLLGWLFL